MPFNWWPCSDCSTLLQPPRIRNKRDKQQQQKKVISTTAKKLWRRKKREILVGAYKYIYTDTDIVMNKKECWNSSTKRCPSSLLFCFSFSFPPSPPVCLFASVHARWLKKGISPIERSTGRRKWPDGTRRRSTGLPEQDGTVRTANDFWPAYSLSCFYLFFFINCFPSLFCFYFAKKTKRGREKRFFPPSDRKREDLSVHLRSSRGHPVVSPFSGERERERRRRTYNE